MNGVKVLIVSVGVKLIQLEVRNVAIEEFEKVKVFVGMDVGAFRSGELTVMKRGPEAPCS